MPIDHWNLHMSVPNEDIYFKIACLSNLVAKPLSTLAPLAPLTMQNLYKISKLNPNLEITSSKQTCIVFASAKGSI